LKQKRKQKRGASPLALLDVYQGACFDERNRAGRSARQWGNAMNGKGQSTILEIQLPRGQAAQLMRLEKLNGIGPARYGELEQLREAVIKAIGP
jgi:hypothetical protein